TFLQLAPRVRRHVVAEKRPHLFTERQLFLGKSEIHRILRLNEKTLTRSFSPAPISGRCATHGATACRPACAAALSRIPARPAARACRACRSETHAIRRARTRSHRASA